MPGRLPDWIIVGAMKSGTTTLYYALGRSPQVVKPVRKEIRYFSRYWTSKSLDWYCDHFLRFPLIATGEASTSYMSHPEVAERIASVAPHVRIIAILRDPVERAYSQWGHQVQRGRETLGFADAIDAEPNRLDGVDPDDIDVWDFSYVGRSMYADELERFYRHFPRHHIKVLAAEELYADPRAVVSEVCGWLGIREPSGPFLPRNVGRPRAPMDQALREDLQARFEEPNRRLVQLVGRDFPWTSSYWQTPDSS